MFSLFQDFWTIAQFFVKKEKTIDTVHIVAIGTSIDALAIQITYQIVLILINTCEKQD